MPEFTKAAKLTDIPEGSMKTVSVNGINITLAHVGGEFFAIADACTHLQCSLGTQGSLDGNVITCGCHGAKFDVKTGRVMALPAIADEPSYPVKIEGDDILVQI